MKECFGSLPGNSKDALKLQALDCSVELQSISGASATLVKAIEKIVNKAQLELMSKNREVENIKEASDKKIELANIELVNRVKELELKNKSRSRRAAEKILMLLLLDLIQWKVN